MVKPNDSEPLASTTQPARTVILARNRDRLSVRVAFQHERRRHREARGRSAGCPSGTADCQRRNEATAIDLMSRIP